MSSSSSSASIGPYLAGDPAGDEDGEPHGKAILAFASRPLPKIATLILSQVVLPQRATPDARAEMPVFTLPEDSPSVILLDPSSDVVGQKLGNADSRVEIKELPLSNRRRVPSLGISHRKPPFTCMVPKRIPERCPINDNPGIMTCKTTNNTHG